MATVNPVVETFNPVVYSLEECQFLIDHLGEPPMVALRAVPANVIPVAVQSALDRIYQLQEAERRLGEPWVGLKVVKQSLQNFLDQSAKWERDAKRGAPRFPSLFSFDTRNRPHRGGPGSDSGVVSTYFDSKGNRIPFAFPLYGTRKEEWAPEWANVKTGTETPPSEDIFVDEKNHRVECKICGHTQHFKTESRGSLNAAHMRMAKHLLKATDEPERHREAHSNAYGN